MDREELGESSSSQNVNITITGIKRGAKGKDVCLLSDGSSFFVPPGFAAKYGLLAGQSLPSDRVLEIKHLALFTAAKRKALELLSFREHSGMQLRQKLLLKDYPDNIIREVLDSLADEGSLDEERFCRTWIHSRLKRHPEWGRVLTAGLAKAGINTRLAERIVREELSKEDEYEVLSRTAAKLERKRGVTKEKIVKNLLSRGFSYNRVLYYSNNID